VASQPEEITVDKDISINIFRIFQEILTNISNHAGATQINVRLENTDGKMTMVVEDNGKGITDEQLASPSAFGIIGMRERVRFLHGEITIKGEPGRGTVISVVVPVHGPG
jgi:signal transduction histidine kinase